MKKRVVSSLYGIINYYILWGIIMNYVLIFLLLFNFYMLILFFTTLTIDKKYYNDKRDLFYFLSNIFYQKSSYYDIKTNKYFNLAIQNGFIDEINNNFILSAKGLAYYQNNNFTDSIRIKFIAITTLIFTFSNLILQVVMLLSKQFE